MQLHLEKDICFFDIEATGLHVIRDRIVQIAIIKYFKDPGKSAEELLYTINPGVPISAEALAVHGIDHTMVRNKPTFIQLAQEIYDFIGKSDLAGYNLRRLDIPLLMEEFNRAGIEFSIKGRKIIDVQKIFNRMEPRTLSAALRFYTGKTMEDAHNAMADVRATVDILDGQLQRYQDVDCITQDGVLKAPIVNDVKALHTFTEEPNMLDVTKKLKYDPAGNIVFNFGKYQGQLVKDVFKRDPNYYHWIMKKEFSIQVKRIVSDLKKEDDKA